MSPESQLLYQVLLSATAPLTAKQLAIQLKIVPNTVYRLTEELIKLGLVTKKGKYPFLFSAKLFSDGLSMFLLNQHNWFTNTFTKEKLEPRKKEIILQSEEISISFIQSRDELMHLSIGETDKTNESIDLLRSGGEISADLMLSLIKAKARGVNIRMLIQDYSSKNTDQVASWKKNGILIRKTALRHIRLMLYDARIIYFMSYRHTDSDKDMGMKIIYPPFAAILFQLFEEWWDEAKII